ncbi:unnamed protein product [Schistosoma rodhaini]|uniref:Uncharacterized protein n=1 Tax=Schistosoma rodhaini TaxID=6188 RepID=A0AA85GDC7_9TREM|nr:unnamed protein product [Schistosoma rodhaini]
MLKFTYCLLILSIIFLLFKSCDGSFLNSTWQRIKKRVTSEVFYFDLYLVIYNWLRSCLLNTDNLREVLYPSEFDDI